MTIYKAKAYYITFRAEMNLLMNEGTYPGGSNMDVGRIRHAECAVTRQLCRQAHIKNDAKPNPTTRVYSRKDRD